MRPSTWTLLPSFNSTKETPQLFVQTTFSSSGYSVWLTDLSRLWSETLDRRKVIKRALDDETQCEIDPTEDSTQLHILLDKIGAGLEGAQGSARRILPHDVDNHGLVLHLTIPLPKPYSPLRWPIFLKLQPPTSLKECVLLPVINFAYVQRRQTDDLIKHLKEKDHVITKLLDKLEASGADISTIFPSAAGLRSSKKESLREQAARLVRGLGEFDESTWAEELKQTVNTEGGSPMLAARNILATVDVTLPHSSQQSPEPWWKDALELTPQGTGDQEPDAPRKSAGKKQGSEYLASGDTEDETETESSDFQATPRSLGKGKSSSETIERPDHQEVGIRGLHIKAGAYSDSETADQSDHDLLHNAPEMRTKQSSFQERNPKKLGVIGGRKTKSNSSQNQPISHASTADSSEGETAGEVDVVLTRSEATLRKQRIGVIGGKKVRNEVESRRFAEDFPLLEPEKDAPNERSGSASANEQAQRHQRDSSTERVAQSTNSSSSRRITTRGASVVSEDEPPESSQARADRKREELKRQLEVKARMPVKKKRKF